MKKLFVLTIFFLFTQLSAQQKYQSLLWKISGNNLKKDSYIYGTMHVSSKVAFRLDDVFYSSLKSSDIVALESDPTLWMKHSYEMMSGMPNNPYRYGFRQKDFYESSFGFYYPNKNAIRSAIRFDNSIINGYLYRKNSSRDNFEEETYLDMFIFQAGKKQLKPVIGLENFKESRYLTTKARYNVRKKKIDSWLLKRYKDKSRFAFTEDAYRDRNLDLLDSISIATNTEHFRKYMLYERNYNMVEVLDSLMQKKSIFAGVGAAHLPGENGMIEMLRDKGYEVTALNSKLTKFGKNSKKQLETTFVKPKLETQSTNDKFISLLSFDKLRELIFLDQKYYVATDMANGAYLAVTRINTFDYLNEKSTIHLKDIDDLLFEDIPGEILKKNYFSEPLKGIEVLNKTKKGDYQRYNIYKTQQEIIIIKLGGKKDYVLKYGDTIFNSISFKHSKDEWQNFTPDYEKYQFSIPSNYITENYSKAGKKIVQSYNNNGFYFFQEVPIHDTNYIEEDNFEASYIHKAFLKEYNIEPTEGRFKNGKYSTYLSSTILDSVKNNRIMLKTIIKDYTYYLLGYVGKDSLSADKFFKSFKILPISYNTKAEKVIDTSLHFSVNSLVKQPFPNLYSSFNNRRRKAYDKFVKNTQYTSKTNEVIKIKRTKYHDLQMFLNVDSLWNDLEKPFKKRYQISHKNKTEKNDVFTYSFLVKDSLSKKQIKIKNIVKKGTLFELKTLQDSLDVDSKFIKNFYESFKPLDTLLGKELFVDKVPDFFKALKENDSIVLSSHFLLKFNQSHYLQLRKIVGGFNFPKDKLAIKNHLVRELIKLEKSENTSFIRQLYTQSYNNPQTQVVIIQSLLEKKDKISNDLVLELLKIDLPIGNNFNMKSLFSNPLSKDSLKLKRRLFPDLLKFSTINEYKTPIYSLLSMLIKEELIKAKEYKKYRNQILNDAKLELKRSLYKNNTKNFNRYSGNRINKSSLLEDYVNILFPYRNEKEQILFFRRLLESEDSQALGCYYALLLKNELQIPEKLANEFFDKTDNFSFLIDKLEVYKVTHKFFENNENWKRYAQSKLFSKQRYNRDFDSISYITNKKINVKDDNVIVYFFKLKRNNKHSTNNISIYSIAFKINNNGVMNLKPYTKIERRGKLLDQINTEEEIIENMLNRVRYKDRKRLSKANF